MTGQPFPNKVPPAVIAQAGLKPGISVVVPVYNSELTLRDLIARLQPALAQLAGQYEVVLVNDGSRDGSWNVVSALAREQAWVRGINLMKNSGQHNALLCGIRAARYDLCVTMDDDLQNPPEEVVKLLHKLEEGFDVVYGSPEALQHGLWRNLASRLAKFTLQRVMGVPNATRASAFRLFRTRLRDAFAEYHNPFVSIDALLTYGTRDFGAVAVRQDSRRVGQSNYTLGKLMLHMLNMFTSFSAFPLRLASMIGFSMTAFGMALLIYVVVRYLIEGSAVAGFPFLAAVISIFSGAQMFALGIMGEYLARIHDRSMGKSPFVIKEMVGE